MSSDRKQLVNKLRHELHKYYFSVKIHENSIILKTPDCHWYANVKVIDKNSDEWVSMIVYSHLSLKDCARRTIDIYKEKHQNKIEVVLKKL